MSTIPSDLQYTKEHEWVRVEGQQATIGITDYAQRQLGETVFVELPKVGQRFERSEPLGTVESVKAVAEYFAPFSGTITQINEALNDEPELVNTEPYGEGWLALLQISNKAHLGELLSADQYERYIAEEQD